MTQNKSTLNICFFVFNWCSYEKDSSRFGITRLQRIPIYINGIGFMKFLKRYTRNFPSIMARPKLCQLIFIWYKIEKRFNKCSCENDSTRFRIAKLQRFQIYINDLRLIKIFDEILILSLFSNHDTFFWRGCPRIAYPCS